MEQRPNRRKIALAWLEIAALAAVLGIGLTLSAVDFFGPPDRPASEVIAGNF